MSATPFTDALETFLEAREYRNGLTAPGASLRDATGPVKGEALGPYIAAANAEVYAAAARLEALYVEVAAPARERVVAVVASGRQPKEPHL